MRRFFNKLATGVMVATMVFTALAPVTTMAAGSDYTHSFTTATYENGYVKTRTCGECGVTVNFVPTVNVDKCTMCGDTKTETLAKLSTGTTTPSTSDKDDKNPSTPTTPSTSDKDSDTIPIKETLAKVGTKYTIGGNQYTVIKAGEEVRFSKANAKKKSVTIPFSKANAKKKSITIPATIKADGISYKVTEVGANAFKNNKNVKKVVIGANVVKIANKAFNKCPNLKSVVIKTTLLTKKTASKKCFSKVNKKMVIKVSKKSKKTYAKIFKGLKVR